MSRRPRCRRGDALNEDFRGAAAEKSREIPRGRAGLLLVAAGRRLPRLERRRALCRRWAETDRSLSLSVARPGKMVADEMRVFGARRVTGEGGGDEEQAVPR
ncbi:hypothetical protein AAFF_G00175330 [Aldrovandia affinis]|uniref:Uncharacterized protein n=1 Tax=Aldrovandia affinis TaxID=143900 RepID=A0AAD7RKY6_9TELE|nr:hypothetical protein AAFF_G00175330 [Aldrovandia affinis]